MQGLEMSLNPNIPQNPYNVGAFAHQEIDVSQQSVRQQGFQQYSGKTKNKSNVTLSDDDHDDHGGHTIENSADDGKRKMSPWHRMKWTDDMVRLLIMVVYYIGDNEQGRNLDGNESGPESSDPSRKKKCYGVLQKKGKWKSVSRAMMERGFYVSPQQCEDKFNDLNKRYKRVNDIVGKGTACKVVENQALLETMVHISPKMKEEVKKLLNSKHLFFKEMCAYHNSCGHGSGATSSAAGIGSEGGGGCSVQRSPDVCAEPCQTQQQVQQQRKCLHSSGHASMGPNSDRSKTETSKMAKRTSLGEDVDFDDSDDDEDDDVVEGVVKSHGHDYENHDRSSRKKQTKGVNVMHSPSIQQFSSELMNVLQDGSRFSTEKMEWLKTRMVRLEKQHFDYQAQAFELEKQKLKWEKFCSKKGREMEKERLVNERMELENERMVLLIREKELELIDLHNQHSKSDPSIITE
ncbi:hypothetical protein LIER_26824 [Lithospermum erythrorhizon]|uniref:Myb/SANT-like DNA-binding domain-containing protein n=1 Tax=Lithospermum erythrorhizon TaxID=34254 RepID=A0AAV3R9S2_LITER